MAIGKSPNRSAILLSSRVPDHRNAFAIGPFASRVSFASQQRRAFNLIWAIDEDLKKAGDRDGLSDKEIVIVGAGLAGLTSAYAAAAYGANVWVFERQWSLLETLASASHRDIHPTINFWPEEELEATTYFPFFNWIYGKCPDVIYQIRDFFERGKRPSKIKEVYKGTTVTGAEFQDGKWHIEYKYSKGGRRKKDYDIIIFATGFGTESTIPNFKTPGYWDSVKDEIGAVSESDGAAFDHHVVSGTGDGGLIEVLRLLFKNFRAGDVSFISRDLLEDPTVKKRVAALEDDIAKKYNDLLAGHGVGARNRLRNEIDTLWTELGAGYYAATISDLIGEEDRSRIERNRTDIQKVTLLGEWSAPFELGSSPYHKLLIAYCIRRGLIEYLHVERRTLVESTGKLKHIGKDGNTKQIDSKKVRIVKKGSLKATEDSDLGVLSIPPKGDVLDNAFFVCRHGFHSPIKRFFSSDVVEKLEEMQGLYSDHDWMTLEQADFYADSLGLPPPSESVWFAEAHMPQALACVTNRHNLSLKMGEPETKTINVRDKRGKTQAVPRYIAVYELEPIVDPSNPAAHKPVRDSENVPRKLFGITVNKANINAYSPPVQYNKSGF